MDLLDYRYILVESDAQIRRLERQWREAGDPAALIPLILAYYRAGDTRGLLNTLPNASVEELEVAGVANADLLRLYKLATAARKVGSDKIVDVLNGESVTKYIVQNVKLPKPNPKSRATMVEVLEPFLPLLAQDARTAAASAKAFKFVWEEIEDPETMKLAHSELAKSPTAALRYFEIYQQIVERYDRMYWPWRFGDPLGESVLSVFADNPSMAIKFAEIAAKLDPIKEPWPTNTAIGVKAVLTLSRNTKLWNRYLDLPQATKALNNSQIRAVVERGQSQNY